jgi:uncharacterized phage protein gp47/JayE
MAFKVDILTALLGAIPNTYDKSVGSFIYDNLAAVAEQIAGIDTDITAATDKLSIENLNGDELERRVKELTGITRKAATFATGSVTVMGTGTINIGDLFETSAGSQLKSTEIKVITTSGDVNVQAVVSGTSGNVSAGTITLFPVTLTGFTAVTNGIPTKEGFDAESDADLLQRYYDYIQTPATSGNKNQYLIWAKSVSGVGDARAIALWNGNNTVKVVILDSNKQPAASLLVSTVQNFIDPGVTGLGDGVAPIGAFVTVKSATGVNINIVSTIVLSIGYDLATTITNIQNALTVFLQSIAYKQSIVSYAKVGDTILNAEGVEDYSGMTVNGGTVNIAIGNEEVAVLGTTTIGI